MDNIDLRRGMTAVLEARGICKSFGHVEVLRDVDFEAEAGQVTALIGDNGAGKSTLIKILSGALGLDSGTITLDGRPISLASPTHARDIGIETVYQDLALAPELGPAENTFAGRELLGPGCSASSACSTRRRCASRPARRSARWAPTSRTSTRRSVRCPAGRSRAWRSAAR